MRSIYHLLSRQIPKHIQQKYPTFCKFVEYYYRWLQTTQFVSEDNLRSIDSNLYAVSITEDSNSSITKQYLITNYLGKSISNGQAKGEVVGVDSNNLVIRYLTADSEFTNGDQYHICHNSDDSITDDLTTGTINNIQPLPSAFIEHFSKLLDSDQLFDVRSANIGIILRHIRQVYQSKGNEQGLKYLIKALKNVDAEIITPWDNVLKLSDGRWNQTYTLSLQTDPDYLHYTPTDIKTVRIYSVNDLTKYTDVPVTKVEVFGKYKENYDRDSIIVENNANDLYKDNTSDLNKLTFDSENDSNKFDSGVWDYLDNKRLIINNYDDNGPWWIRDQDDDPAKNKYTFDPKTGAIIFDDTGKSQSTYGRWGTRYVTQFVRLHFDSNINGKQGQIVDIVDENNNTVYRGKVIKGISGIKIVDGGSRWQVGEIFTSSKQDLWYSYNAPYTDVNTHYVSTINSFGIPVEYSVNKPLIGRVTAVSNTGEIQGVELVQLGDFVPLDGSKREIIVHSRNPNKNDNKCQATISLTYSDCPKGVGSFDDYKGQLSNPDVRIEDDDYYQQYSYDIVSSIDSNKYVGVAKLFHPAGTKMFTTYNIEATLNACDDISLSSDSGLYEISLFDVVLVAEQIANTFTKKLTDSFTFNDLLRSQVTKQTYEQTFIVDHSPNHDNTISYSSDRSYDQRNTNTGDGLVFKRDVNATDVDNRYVVGGTESVVHFNYDSHIIEDFPPTQPEQQDQQGGLVKISIGDCVELFSDEQSYQKAGNTVVIKFGLDATKIKSFTAVAYDYKDDPLPSNLVYDQQGIYTLSFEMVDHDVDVAIKTVSNIHNITIVNPRGFVASIDRKQRYTNDIVTVSTNISGNNIITKMYYVSDSLNQTVDIEFDQTLNKYVFTMPDSDVEIHWEYASTICHININIDGNGMIVCYDTNDNVIDTNEPIDVGSTIKIVCQPSTGNSLVKLSAISNGSVKVLPFHTGDTSQCVSEYTLTGDTTIIGKFEIGTVHYSISQYTTTHNTNQPGILTDDVYFNNSCQATVQTNTDSITGVIDIGDTLLFSIAVDDVEKTELVAVNVIEDGVTKRLLPVDGLYSYTANTNDFDIKYLLKSTGGFVDLNVDDRLWYDSLINFSSIRWNPNNTKFAVGFDNALEGYQFVGALSITTDNNDFCWDEETADEDGNLLTFDQYIDSNREDGFYVSEVNSFKRDQSTILQTTVDQFSTYVVGLLYQVKQTNITIKSNVNINLIMLSTTSTIDRYTGINESLCYEYFDIDTDQQDPLLTKTDNQSYTGTSGIIVNITKLSSLIYKVDSITGVDSDGNEIDIINDSFNLGNKDVTINVNYKLRSQSLDSYSITNNVWNYNVLLKQVD